MTAVRRLRAEWEPQSAILVAWPYPDSDWGPDLELTERVYDDIVGNISRYQPVLVLANSDSVASHIRRRFRRLAINHERICIHILDFNDTWTRDYGPLAVDEGEATVLMDFRFNGWGGKFDAHLDDRVSDRLNSDGLLGNLAYHHLPWVLEGGAVETDGQHTMLATTSSVLSESRNPGSTKEDMEAMFRCQLGIHRFHWLESGAISGDDTDGHIDTLVRFANPFTLLHTTAARADPDFHGLNDMARELASLRTAEDSSYRLVPLPSPGIHHDENGQRIPATYANFLILNGAVLAPIYGTASDQSAISILKEHFPGRAIIPIDCRGLIRQNGSLHCATMQIPAGGFECPVSEQ